MLEQLGEQEAASLVYDGVAHVALNGPRTMDLGGEAKTPDVGDAVEAFIRAKN
jgi:tartrate dehydrogenase/decarboxylase/D-malate dehydrogenase